MSRKTAGELGITQEEFDDLVWVRDALDPSKVEVELPRWLEFDMRNWLVVPEGDMTSCGTIACLGGTMNVLRLSRRLGVGLDDVTEASIHEADSEHSVALSRLFYNWDHKQPRSTELAVRAVDNFLAGSKRPWDCP